ncbi:hypothetical protein J4558_12720 [Leptolyngbya sp. 15MV]|nr:hypothetical protein J4558_12720 [Leptolyngbya sp. 15MV]
MRLDIFLKLSRLLSRRTAAAAACQEGRVRVNGTTAKAVMIATLPWSDRESDEDIVNRSSCMESPPIVGSKPQYPIPNTFSIDDLRI